MAYYILSSSSPLILEVSHGHADTVSRALTITGRCVLVCGKVAPLICTRVVTKTPIREACAV